MMSAFRSAEAFISSAIKNSDGEAESVKYSLVAEYGYSDGRAEISYRESSEGGPISTLITFDGRAITVLRRGAVNSKIVLTEGEAHKSVYTVGAFSFDMTVTARKIRAELSELGGRLDVLYKMTVGGADKDVRFGIRIKVASNEHQ